MKDLDLFDAFTALLALFYTAANFDTSPFYFIPAIGVWLIIHLARKTEHYHYVARNVASKVPKPRLPSLPTEDSRSIANDNGFAGWYERVTKENVAPKKETRPLQALEPQEKITPEQNMSNALAAMPKILPYNHPKIPKVPTPTSVLVGYDSEHKKMIWADFGKYSGDTFHTFVAGQIGAGKDTMLRLWFTQLTMNNSPDEIQFIIIDAKGEWITPALKDSLHMFIPPVGEFNLQIRKNDKGKRQLIDLANEAIEDGLIKTIELLQERAQLFAKAGTTNIQAYEQKTGRKLPLLFIIATDVGTNLEGILDKLIAFVVLKGRSFGVRAIISMQTASGQNTSWRGQMSMVLSGSQGLPSADTPNMGIPVPLMKYRPSQLPDVGIAHNRGLFVYRKGSDQAVVRGAYLPDHLFEEYCETRLPRRTNNMFLDSLLTDNQPMMVIEKPTTPKYTLTREQSIKAAELAAQGIAPSYITKILGFTSDKRYNDMMPIVSAIHKAVQTKRALKQGANR
jgi:hypothetical protein